MNHELKIDPAYFKAVASGAKAFEIRKADRPFEVDDTLTLREYDRRRFRDKDAALEVEPYTGNEVDVLVNRLWGDNMPGIQTGFCVMAIQVLEVRS